MLNRHIGKAAAPATQDGDIASSRNPSNGIVSGFSKLALPLSQVGLALTLALCLSGPLAASPLSGTPEESRCRRVPLEEPLWIMGWAEWIGDRQEIAVPDPIGGRVLGLTLDGKVAEKLVDDRRPTFAFTRVGRSYLQIANEKKVQWLDENLRPEKTVDLTNIDGHPLKNDVDAYRLDTIIFGSIAGDYLVAYGSLDSSRDPEQMPRDGKWEATGFFVQELVRPGREDQANPPARLILPDSSEINSHLYVTGYPLVATIATDAFMVQMGRTAVLYHYDTLSNTLQAISGFPWEDTELPALRTDLDLASQLVPYDALVGLYQQDDYLYGLSRTPNEDGETSWSLTKMRPVTDLGIVKVYGTLTLPTTTEQLSIAPTPEHWVVFEKGRSFLTEQLVPSRDNAVRKLLVNDISKMLVIPTSWIRDGVGSPLWNMGADRVDCD